MKKITAVLLALLGLLTLTACAGEQVPEQAPWAEQVDYTNVSTPETRALLEELLEGAGIPEDRRQVLYANMDRINGLLEPGELAGDFERLPIGETRYDPYVLQDRWMAAFPDFQGYNCRITAFSLFESCMEVEPTGGEPDPFLFLDADALVHDSGALPRQEDRDRFFTLYETAVTTASQDTGVQLQTWQEHWRQRGVTFPEGGRASLISVVFHDRLDEDQLSVGHAGVLLTGEDGTLYFLEKLAFQEPYRLCRFQTTGQLSDYLMTCYDVSFGQGTAAPLVLRNGELIEGYRIRPRS